MSDPQRPVVMLVDDSEFSLSRGRRALGEAFEILTAANGAEALLQLEERTVDLVITDLLMPQVSGLAFLGQARQRYPQLKVVVCSADVQDATASKAKELGAAAFLAKPIDPEELQRVVKLVLSQRQAPRELPITPRYADAFKEIFNIGVGRVARALSKLVYDTVKLSVPELQILRPYHLAGYVADAFDGELACVRQPFTGTTDGTAYLLLNAQSGLSLVNALAKDRTTPSEALSTADQSMLTEVGNILINSLVGTLANTLGIRFDFGQADCRTGDAQSIYGNLSLRDSDYVLYLETLFVVPGKSIGGTLVILLGSAGMGTVLDRIDNLG
ncbi:MAG: response regulator [Myxococcota bacterium]